MEPGEIHKLEPLEPERRLYDSMDSAPPESEPPLPELQTPTAWQHAIWPVYLCLRPRFFFERFVIEDAPLLTALCAWIFGISAGYDRMSNRALAGQEIPFSDHWGSFLLMLAFGGSFGGLFVYLVGGWWYRVRLKWSGAKDPDKKMARRVYLYASTVYTIPNLLVVLFAMTQYSRPIDFLLGNGMFIEFLPVLMVLWSVVVSYIGVRTAFNVRGFLGALWFLILPLTLYGITFVGVVLLVLFSSLPMAPPAVQFPAQYSASSIQFAHPSNWRIVYEEEGFDAESFVSVEPLQDAYIWIVRYMPEGSMQEEIAWTENEMTTYYGRLKPVEEITRFGSFPCTGNVYQFVLDGTRYRLRLCVMTIADDEFVEIREVCRVDEAQELGPGFKLIERTMRLSPLYQP